VVANMYISSINPVLFPYIQLSLYTKDGIHRTPAQMKWWRVFYQPVPEIAVNPNVYTYYHADTLQYGDNLKFQTTVQNISDWPIASTQLLTWVGTQNNTITYYNQGQMVKPLNPGDTAKISFVMNDANSNMNTLKSVWFEVNPEAYPDTRLEQYHFNNYASKTFYSYGDKINPVLDVTFDGIHILNNDIVSAQPNILMNFMDENKFLALKDPSDFQVWLNPIGSTPQLVPYGSTLSFTPAVLPHNKCSLLLTPTLADGTYQLTVQGKDISGNFSANNSYTVDFQVINKPMITEVLNYPNPFSTSTRFVFILTGEQIPTTFKIQIMTVSGKIVKEINEDEIGPIHIGRNITQYAWDGTDQYGSKLANGVYLYRVITNINGQGIDEYQQGYQGANIDKFFTKSWGKMYLMR
jgi:flagellar hook assembly protein FlgD